MRLVNRNNFGLSLMQRTAFRRAVSLSLLPALIAFAAAPATAQAPPDQSVADRARPAYDPLGLRLRSFEVFPSITATVAHDDNVYASETNEESDLITEISPALLIRSAWPRHELSLNLEGEARRYADFDAEDANSWRASVDGRVDVRRTLRIYGGVSESDGREARGSNDPAGIAEPIAVRETRAAARVEADLNRVRLSAGAATSDIDYDDAPLLLGGVLDQDFRDRTSDSWFARADYALSPGTSLFVTYEERTYDYTTVAQRDYETQQVLAGVATEFGNLIRGEFAVGQVSSSFDEPGASEPDGLSLRGHIEWYPRQTTTVTFDIGRDIAESSIAPAASTLREDFAVRVDHELRRNIILSAGVRRANEDFNAVDRTDESEGWHTGVRWLVNRLAEVGLVYAHDEEVSRGADRDRDFTRNVLALSLRLQR